MPVVRAAVPRAARRLPATVLRGQVQDDVLVRAAALGRAGGRVRLTDHRRHQDRRCRSVHAPPRGHLAVTGTGGRCHRHSDRNARFQGCGRRGYGGGVGGCDAPHHRRCPDRGSPVMRYLTERRISTPLPPSLRRAPRACATTLTIPSRIAWTVINRPHPGPLPIPPKKFHRIFTHTGPQNFPPGSDDTWMDRWIRSRGPQGPAPEVGVGAYWIEDGPREPAPEHAGSRLANGRIIH